MQQNAPIESGLGSFAKAFGEQVAKGEEDKRADKKTADKEAFDKWKLGQQEAGKDKRAAMKGNSKSGQDPKDKNFVTTFRAYQTAWKSAVQNYINEHSDMSKNPQEAIRWNALSKADKNAEIADQVEKGELNGLKQQHDFVYDPDNMARFSKLNGVGAGNSAQPAKPATAGDLQATPIVAPTDQGHTVLPPQMRPTPPPQSRPNPVMAQAPAPKLKFPMAPATPEDIQGMTAKQPMVASLPGGPTGANAQTNTPIPGQGPAASQDEEEVG